jgi:hypothetical protein
MSLPMAQRKTMSRWSEFADLTRGAAPRELLVEAEALMERRDAALDLGAGALNETRYLLERGFKCVVALDLEPRPADAAALPAERLRYMRIAIEDYRFPGASSTSSTPNIPCPMCGRSISTGCLPASGGRCGRAAFSPASCSATATNGPAIRP